MRLGNRNSIMNALPDEPQTTSKRRRKRFINQTSMLDLVDGSDQETDPEDLLHHMQQERPLDAFDASAAAPQTIAAGPYRCWYYLTSMGGQVPNTHVRSEEMVKEEDHQAPRHFIMSLSGDMCLEHFTLVISLSYSNHTLMMWSPSAGV